MAAQRAPRYDMSLPPTKTRVFTNPGAVALDAISGLPAFGALRLDVLCTAAAGALTVTHEDGTALVYAALPAGASFPILGPIKAFVSSTTVIVTATWWGSPGMLGRDPQYEIFSNP